MKIRLIAVSISLLVAFNWQRPVALAQVSARQMEHSQQDNRLFNQMTKVSDWFAQYCTWNHRFPEGWEQVNFAKQQLNQLVPNIPYDSGDLQLSQGLDAEADFANPTKTSMDAPQPIQVAASMDRIQINPADLSMTGNDILQYRTQPPLEWNAPPGTITAISNQSTTFLIWGAGSDGLPIRDPDTGRVRLIVGHYGQLFDNEE
ncbi:MAG TPA: hypothetical protein V6C76_00625 [Drouetiella sp.]